MIMRKEVIQQMKAIRIFRRNVSNAVKSIFRNFSLSIASVICTTITLIIVALAMIFSANVNSFTKDLENTLTIIAYIDSNATEEEIGTIKSKLLEIKNIKSDEMIYKDKEAVKEDTIKNSKDTRINKITNVQYSESVVKKMIPVFDIVKKVTLVIILGLIIVTDFLICNTIKLTIFARKNEIEIMRLVGTSNFVIKLPFVIEGLFLGIIGAIIPILASIWGYIIAYDKLEGYFFTNFIKMIKPLPFTIYVSLALLCIGAIVGMFGSYTAVRKYLKI